MGVYSVRFCWNISWNQAFRGSQFWLAFFATKWAGIFPCLFTWENWICENPIHSSRTPWITEATVEGEGEEPAKALTNTCESPSNTTAEQPRHWANKIPTSSAFDSASSGPREAFNFLHKTAATFPKLSWITTPIPVALISLKLAASTFTLYKPDGGGDQYTI